MATRVKQADGTYCYTANCRIHDRSLSDSTGLEAVLADVTESQRAQYSTDSLTALQQKLGDRIPEEFQVEIADRIIEEAANSDSGILPQTIAESLNRAAGEHWVSLSPMECIEAAHEIFSKFDQNRIIQRGDEVILTENGERGTISEGSTAFGGLVRFNPEDSSSRNSFAWMQSSDVTKIGTPSSGLVREEILAAPRDAIIPITKVKEMIEQETSPKTRNAQANREFSRKNGTLSRSVLRDYAERLGHRFEGKSLTKGHIVRLLNQEYQRPIPELNEKQIWEVKAGLGNIINYLERVK